MTFTTEVRIRRSNEVTISDAAMQIGAPVEKLLDAASRVGVEIHHIRSAPEGEPARISTVVAADDVPTIRGALQLEKDGPLSRAAAEAGVSLDEARALRELDLYRIDALLLPDTLTAEKLEEMVRAGDIDGSRLAKWWSVSPLGLRQLQARGFDVRRPPQRG